HCLSLTEFIDLAQYHSHLHSIGVCAMDSSQSRWESTGTISVAQRVEVPATARIQSNAIYWRQCRSSNVASCARSSGDRLRRIRASDAKNGQLAVSIESAPEFAALEFAISLNS